MDQETFQLTVIALLTELVENTRMPSRKIHYGTNPPIGQIISVIEDYLAWFSDGKTIEEIYDHLVSTGLKFTSTNPRRMIGAYLYRERQREASTIVLVGGSYRLRPNPGGVGSADLKQVDRFAKEI